MPGFTKRLLVLLLVAALPAGAGAQVLYGSLTGTVTDSTGAVIGGATVRALNVGTNVTKEATTDTRGAFLFSDLLPGQYDVTFEAAGFTAVVHKGVRVDSNAVRRVDGRLEVSGVSETLEVTALLETRQDELRVPANLRARAVPTAQEPTVVPVSGSRSRAMAATALAGGSLTLVAVYWVERWRRRARAARTAPEAAA